MAIFDLHHPWLFVFGVLGNIISIFVYLAPWPTFRRIYKEKSTMGYQSVPYVVALFSSMLWIYYSFLKKNAILLISINSFGCIVETIYISLFLLYASKGARRQTIKLLVCLIGGLFSTIFLVTLFPLHGSIRVQVVGWICVAVSVAVFAAPLSIVFKVIRTKSVEFMPFTLSFFLTLSAIMWFGYGLLQRDVCVALPNVIGFFLGILQMILYGIYRNVKPAPSSPEKKMPMPEHVVNMAVLGTPDRIHPVNSDDRINKLEEAAQSQDDEEKAAENHDNDDGRSPPSPVANDHEDEEYSGDQPTQVNVQQLDAPALVLCAV